MKTPLRTTPRVDSSYTIKEHYWEGTVLFETNPGFHIRREICINFEAGANAKNSPR